MSVIFACTNQSKHRETTDATLANSTKFVYPLQYARHENFKTCVDKKLSNLMNIAQTQKHFTHGKKQTNK